MNVPITQSKQWQTLQNDLGITSFYREESDFVALAIKKSTPLGHYLYLPYGPVATNEAGLSHALSYLKHLAESERAMFVRVEPQQGTKPDFVRRSTQIFGRPPVKSHNQNPAETWLLDLTGGEESVRSRLPSRLLRYHRNATKQGITIRKSHDPADIHYLLSLQKALAEKKNISTFSEHYLATELAQPFATLYLVEHRTSSDASPEVVAAGLVFDDKTTRYNLQGSQNDQGRTLHATGILTIELINDAVKNHQTTFDFWGIAPEGAPASHPWAGFTAFKKTFAGHEQCYLGTFDLILSPLRYRLYQLLRKLRRAL